MHAGSKNELDVELDKRQPKQQTESVKRAPKSRHHDDINEGPLKVKVSNARMSFDMQC